MRTRALVLALALVLSACQPTVSSLAQPTTVTGEHRIALRNADGSPVRWNPCQPILIVADFRGAPSFARAELDAAIAGIRSASGLDLRFAGTTTERPTTPLGGRTTSTVTGWAPIRLTFATATELPFADPTAMGWGQAIPLLEPTTGRYQYVMGQVVLRPHGWTQGPTSANPLTIMLRHELGHVLGLGHVRSTDEIMTSAGNGHARRWGPGDLVGLRAIGRPAGCLPALR
jgi:hypothetical protein